MQCLRMIGISRRYSREAVFLKTLCLLLGKKALETLWMEKGGRTILLGCYNAVANKSCLLATRFRSPGQKKCKPGN